MDGTTTPLDGQVALVAGATRGAGRGIARALGEAGAIVYCTGRSMRGNPSPYRGRKRSRRRPRLIDDAPAAPRSPFASITPIESEVEALVSGSIASTAGSTSSSTASPARIR